MAEPVVAVVLAAGTGSRVGHELPKQFLDLNGTPVLGRTVAGLLWCDEVVVVHHPDHLDRTRGVVSAAAGTHPVRLVAGGATRRASISAALAALEGRGDQTPVVLQNAASPNTPRALVEECVAALDTHDVVQAYVPALHTVFRHQGGELTDVLPRSSLGYSADPTVYRLGCLRRIAAAQAEQASLGEMTLDTARALGIPVRLVPSPASNLKLTTRDDLVVLQAATSS